MIGMVIICNGCGLEDAGKSDCAIYVEDTLDNMQESYETEAYDNNVDDKGNRQSLTTCSRTKELTDKYLKNLEILKEDIQGRLCSGEELLRLTTRIERKEKDLNEDLENVWNRCEEIYGPE